MCVRMKHAYASFYISDAIQVPSVEAKNGNKILSENRQARHDYFLTDHYEESFDFYTRLLGFRLSDSMVLDKRPLRFLRCNPRHHSLALAPHHSSRLAHMMLEVPTIDEVGYCIDRCARNDVPIAMTLGRHTNDMMVSFYLRAPRGYEIEYGCEGLRVDENTWTTQEITAVSFWGHQREMK